MRNPFLEELDRWLVAVLQAKLIDGGEDTIPEPISAAHFAEMISDYVLLRLADQPTTCWTACEIDHVSNEAILAATTFSEDLLAAALIGAVCELSMWEGGEGVAFMIQHGVPPDDAQEIAAAMEVVTEKLGARGQTIVQRLCPSDLSAGAQEGAVDTGSERMLARSAGRARENGRVEPA